MARIAIIGGSGSAWFPARDEAPAARQASAWGEPSGPVGRWTAHGHELLFLGRHGPAGQIPPHRINYCANIDVLRQLGVERIVALNAVGGIAPELRAGVLALPHQLVDYTWGRQHSFFNGESESIEFIDFTEPYDINLRSDLSAAAARAGVSCRNGGVYGVTQGPRLETAAEIDRLERDGCTMVGMTSMPEAALAREAGIPYACLALVVNPAAGRGSGEIHADIERHLQGCMAAAAAVIDAYLEGLA